mmetsp:Transcript_62680/g.161299  ORF Transcript_62680/g.161299 Transcript_62680/m.161299 type:complete len:110 (-) Transcript_62680:98-427(-)
MQDLACDYVAGYTLAKALNWDRAQQFRNAPMEDFEVEGVVAGSRQSAGGLTWVQVMGSGHMVPIDSPAAASRIINEFIEEINGNPDMFQQQTQLRQRLSKASFAWGGAR